MKIKAVVVICSLLIVASIELCLNAAAEPLVTGQLPLTVYQTAGATKLADAIKSNDYKIIPMIFASYFTKGILIYENPTAALQLTEQLEQTIKTKLEEQKSLASLQNLAGQRFSKIIENSKKMLMAAQKQSWGEFEKINQVVLQIAEYLSYDALVKWMRTSHEIYKTLLPEMQRRKELINYWTNHEFFPVITIKGDHNIGSIDFSHDGTTIASNEIGEDVIRIWDVRTGKQMQTIHKEAGSLSDVCFSLKSNKLAYVSTHNTAAIWDLDKNVLIASKTLQDPTSKIISLALSPDEHMLAIGCDDGKIVLWNISTDKTKLFSAHNGGVNTIAFSRDGTKFVSGGYVSRFKIWDSVKVWETAKTIYTFPEATNTVSVAFSPDNETVAATNAEMKEYPTDEIILLNINDNKKRILKGPKELNISSIDFSPDGMMLVAGLRRRGYSGTIKLWALNTGTPIHEFETGSVSSVKFSPTGKIIASCSNNQLQLWKAKE